MRLQREWYEKADGLAAERGETPDLEHLKDDGTISDLFKHSTLQFNSDSSIAEYHERAERFVRSFLGDKSRPTWVKVAAAMHAAGVPNTKIGRSLGRAGKTVEKVVRLVRNRIMPLARCPECGATGGRHKPDCSLVRKGHGL